MTHTPRASRDAKSACIHSRVLTQRCRTARISTPRSTTTLRSSPPGSLPSLPRPPLLCSLLITPPRSEVWPDDLTEVGVASCLRLLNRRRTRGNCLIGSPAIGAEERTPLCIKVEKSKTEYIGRLSPETASAGRPLTIKFPTAACRPRWNVYYLSTLKAMIHRDTKEALNPGKLN
jgi:hypothetical protein